ncbi:hypothetical protein [Rhodovastum atsumiense]|uniref:Uncharacterized protein n=1 Tax=Rhodovastum atsumiense TaxID=504468 RepID=A0A5M6II48_9PROT|nr:hypothetical protein [Rhodovastum atsumiense]KAA5607941.1 hypothetical protein F1189_31465 [Rhodovastum atsumiense]
MTKAPRTTGRGDPGQSSKIAAALRESIATWASYLFNVDALPPSWPINWRPDGAKPCIVCHGRRWWRLASDPNSTTGYGPGWCCQTCHPPLAGASILTAPEPERIAA